eukprot:TRINITY_DN776101_c0_g1_i1.p1 TRINITY_DN776101_c0_g1~~TRINITY_DN776101_c0_g1_i1.p1  ORF type:complete len:503 (+),score=191.54 TRINITY_DN776101_c0_g1_i1:145-1653(+)
MSSVQELGSILGREVNTTLSLDFSSKGSGVSEEAKEHEGLKKGKLDPSKKTIRHFAGQVPSMGAEEDEDEIYFKSRVKIKREEPNTEMEKEEPRRRSRFDQKTTVYEDEARRKTKNHATTDPRLLRLQKRQSSAQSGRSRRRHYEAEVIETNDSDSDEQHHHSRRQHQAEIISDNEDNDNEMSDKEMNDDNRREMIRQRMLAQKNDESSEEELMETEDEDEESEESSEFEESSSEDDEDTYARPISEFKPLFKTKAERLTILEKQQKDLDELEREEQRLKREETKKKESKEMVLEAVMRGDDEEVSATDDDMPSTDDDEDEEAEFEAWRLRELKRKKRDLDIRAAVEEERRETERRAKMSDEQIAADNARLESLGLKKKQPTEKQEWGYLQRYYHKGAFFMDEDTLDKAGKKDVRLRADQYAAGKTLDDKTNKQALPKVMQVKKFGQRGRTKWTHLTAEDTNDYEYGWGAKQDENAVHVRQNMERRMAGTRSLDHRRRRRRT